MPMVIDPAQPQPEVPLSATSTNGKLTVAYDEDAEIVVLTADYSLQSHWPEQVLFLRDGVPVRSGANAFASGGKARAYDYEAPRDAGSSWSAQAVYLDTDGVSYYMGDPSSAGLVLPGLDEDRDFRLVPVLDPLRSVRLRSTGTDPVITTNGQIAVSTIPGSAYPAGTWDVRTKAAIALAFTTYTHQERDTLNGVLDAGPVLVQSLGMYGMPDFYALAVDSSETYRSGAFSPVRTVAVSFQPILRPTATGAPLYRVGHAYGDLPLVYSTYAALATAPTYDALA